MNAANDDSRFTIHDDRDVADSPYMAEAENLRIEKLGTRITLVAILIPCLLVIILGVAYLDIKHRVINTQNTGSIGVQKVAGDLESRFSSLSLRQAKLEAQLTDTVKAVETTTAGIQVKLKKMEEAVARMADGQPTRADVDALSKKTEDLSRRTTADVAAVQKDIQTLNAALAKFDEEVADQILLIADGLKKDQGRLAEITERLKRLESERVTMASIEELKAGMLTRESVELTLGLERLALQTMVEEKTRALNKRLAAMDKRLTRVEQQPGAPSPPPAGVPAPSASPGQPAPTKLEEQTIQ